MKETLKLRHPIYINGVKTEELTYDIEEITMELFTEADAVRKRAAGLSNVSLSIAIEFDFTLHTYIGIAAIIAVNPDYDFEDLKRIHGRDIKEVTRIGRRFFIESEEDGQPSTSENVLETTPKLITQESEN